MLLPNPTIYPTLHIYGRSSEPRQETRGAPSVQTQIDELLEVAKTIPHGKVETYPEEGKSAWKIHYSQRPQFRRLLDNVKQGDLVLVWSLSRIERKPMALPEAVGELSRRGVNVQSMTDHHGGPFLLDTLMGQVFVLLAAIVNAMWVDRMKVDIKRARDYNREHGLWNGEGRGIWPIGRRVVRRKRGRRTENVVKWDEEQLKYVREIDARMQDGEPKLRIARDFVARGIRTAQGRPFVKVEVRKIFSRTRGYSRPVYRINRFFLSAPELMQKARDAGVPDPTFLHPTKLTPLGESVEVEDEAVNLDVC